MEAGQKAALLISECQRITIDPTFALLPNLANAVQARGTIGKIARLAALCRGAAIPVVHCTVVVPADAEAFAASCRLSALMRRAPGFREGHEAVAIDPRLAPHETDIVAERRQGITAFHGDGLEDILRDLQVQTLILAGVSTNIALAGITIGAANRGLTVVLPADCTAGAPPEVHDMMIAHFYALTATVTDLESLEALLAPPG